jgi:uncharacterized protein YicC (UPF0701 family)
MDCVIIEFIVKTGKVMYAQMSFDTHKYVKEFVSIGMPEPQAEAIIRLVHESKNNDLSKLSTRDQVLLLEQKLDSSVVRLEQKLDSSVVRLEQKIDSSVERLEQKIESYRNESKADIERLEQKLDSSVVRLEQKMATKEELSRLETQMVTLFKGLETQIAKQDSSQKAWMMGIFLSIIALVAAVIVKLNFH